MQEPINQYQFQQPSPAQPVYIPPTGVVIPPIQQKKKKTVSKALFCVVALILVITNLITAGILFFKKEDTYSYPGDLLSEGLVGAKSGDKWGFVDESGDFVIAPQFDACSYFYEEMAVVLVNGKYGFIDTKGDFIIEPQFDNAYRISEGLAAVEVGEKWGYIDKDGEFVIEPQFQYGSFFTDGVSVICVDDKYGIIDKEGNYITPPTYDSIGEFCNGMARIKMEDRYGYINTEGEIVIGFRFIYASNMYNDGFAYVVTEDKEYALIDREGNILADRLDGIYYEDNEYCIEEGCYNTVSYDSQYCSTHKSSYNSDSYYPYCEYSGCYNRAYSGNYCTTHDYLEDY